MTLWPIALLSAVLQKQPEFYDPPKYQPAGVTDYTYQGGHGSGAVFRSTKTMAESLEAEAGGNTAEAAVYARGAAQLKQRAVKEALATFKAGVAQFPRSTRMLLGLAGACYTSADYDAAAQWFFRAADLKPEDPKPYLFLGAVKAKQITESAGYKDRMARFVKLHPATALAHYYHAETLPDEAAQPEYAKALQLDPRLAAAHIALGSIASRAGHYDEAIREEQSAIAIDANLEEAHYRLSEAYRLAGNKAKAKEEREIFERLSRH